MKEAPRDRFYLVYFIFVLLGIATLLPWNVFVTETEFYDVRLHIPPYPEFVASNFLSVFGLIFNTSSLLALGILLGIQVYCKVPPRFLILKPLLIVLGVLVYTSMLAVKLDMSGWAMASFTLPALGAMGISSALIQAGTLALASNFPPIYVQGALSGISLGGVAVSILSFVSELKASNKHSDPTSADVAPAAFLYFAVCAGVIALSIIAYLMLNVLNYAKYNIYSRELKAACEESLEDAPEEALDADLMDDLASSSAVDEDDDITVPLLNVNQLRAQKTAGARAFAVYCLAIGLALGVTMVVFPGITAFICSVHNPAKVSPCAASTKFGRYAGDLFVPFMYVVFNIGDFCGRTLSSVGPWSKTPPRSKVLLTYALARMMFIVFFVFCHVVTPRTWHFPTYFESDSYPIAFNLLLGLTQGHLLSTACMHAPTLLPASQAGKYGSVVAFACTFGCFIGSMVSVVLVYIGQYHAAQSP